MSCCHRELPPPSHFTQFLLENCNTNTTQLPLQIFLFKPWILYAKKTTLMFLGKIEWNFLDVKFLNEKKQHHYTKPTGWVRKCSFYSNIIWKKDFSNSDSVVQYHQINLQDTMENNFKTPGWLPSKEALLQVIIMQISHYFSYAHTTIFLQHQYYCGWWNIFWNTHFYTHSPAEPWTISWIFIISMQRVSEWEWHKYHYQPRDEIKWLNCDSEKSCSSQASFIWTFQCW